MGESSLQVLENEYYKVWNKRLKFGLLPNDINLELVLKQSIKTGDSLLQSYVKIKYKDTEFLYIDNIGVPYVFKQVRPNKKKIDIKKKRLRSGDIEPVIINKNNTIVDNYITYLIFIQNGEKFIPVKYCSDVEYNNQNRLEILGHKYNNKCYICGKEVTYNRNDEHLDNFATADHIVPIASGGSNDIDNLALCCSLCNNLKGQLTYSEELKNIIIKELQLRNKLNQ